MYYLVEKRLNIACKMLIRLNNDHRRPLEVLLFLLKIGFASTLMGWKIVNGCHQDVELTFQKGVILPSAELYDPPS